MIIDAWAQHPTLRHLQDPIFEPLRRWSRAKSPIEALPLEQTIASMDAANVSKSIISAWVAPRNVMISNEEVYDFTSRYPNRLVGVGSVDISKPMQAVAEIRRCVSDYGFKGIRVLPWLWERPPTDRLFYPIYTACCDLSIPFCTQIGHTGPLMSSEVGRPIYLDQVALDFPDLVIVAGHIGYPWAEEAIAIATKHANFYIDTSAYSIERYPPELVRYMKGHGVKKVLFGTNYPMMEPAQVLSQLSTLELSPDAEARFLGENASDVYGIDMNKS